MHNIEALLFDVDGTLADTERDGHRVAFNLAFEEQGLKWNWSIELYSDLLKVTGGKERISYYIKQYQPAQVPQIAENDLNIWIADLHKAKTKHYLNLLEQGAVPLRIGVERILRQAVAMKLRLAIATTTTLSNVTTLLKHTLGEESLTWFEIIAAGDIVANKKPAPDIYLYVMEKMQLKPKQCLAFEDSDNGILSAQQADLNTIITVNDYTKNQKFTDALIVLDHLGSESTPMQKLAGSLSLEKAYLDLEELLSKLA